MLSTPDVSTGAPERWFIRKFQQLENVHANAILHNVSNLVGNGVQMRVGTACSGSEVPIIWLGAFFRVCQSILIEVPIDSPRAASHHVMSHTFACEINKAKADRWIRAAFEPPLLFRDILSLGNVRAYDWLSDSLQLVPSVDAFVAGTSCKDFSSAKGLAVADVLTIGTGTSNDTLVGALKFSQAKRPLWISFENVINMLVAATISEALAESNFQIVFQWFKDIGYILYWRVANPTHQKIPTKRLRVYYWGFAVIAQWSSLA